MQPGGSLYAQPELILPLKWDSEWQPKRSAILVLFSVVVLVDHYMPIVGLVSKLHRAADHMLCGDTPLSLVGIVIGHWLMGAYFTATSMIGFIALGGVMVRNSVLLIDFINIRLKEGIPLKQSIIEAGAVRTTPILLTAGAVVLGAIIILFDPISRGLRFR